VFLIAVTREELRAPALQLTITEVRLAGGVLTVAVDGWFARLEHRPDGFCLHESPPPPFNPTTGPMFVRAEWNAQAGQIRVVKSTMSGRPVFFHQAPDGDFACSTHLALLRCAGVRLVEDPEVVPEFFVYRYVMPPRTLYRGIRRLGAGSRLTVDLAGERKRVVCDEYSPPRSEDTWSLAPEDVAQHTIALLQNTLEPLIACIDRVAVSLSGGLDSSILMRLAQRRLGVGQSHSTSYPFEDPTQNIEKHYALSAAKAFETRHEYFEPRGDEYLRGVLEAIAAAEEPLPHLQSVLMHLMLARGVPPSSHLVVSGEGADCIYGLGLHQRLIRCDRPLGRFLGRPGMLPLFRGLAHLTRRGRGLASDLMALRGHRSLDDANHPLWSLEQWGSRTWTCDRFGVKPDALISGRRQGIERFLGRSVHDLVAMMTFFGTVAVTQELWSKLAESQARWMYYPFALQELIDFTSRIPWNIRLREPKSVLRAVARKLHVPQFIIERPKSAFGLRHGRWAGVGGAFEPLVSLTAGVFDLRDVRAVQPGGIDEAMIFWNMINYAVWKRLCIDREPLSGLVNQLQDAIARTGSRGSD
jgi:asparagine synthetase B (glutamine-hydrolysing)